MEYNLAKKKLETLLAGMKRDLVNYAATKDASEGALFKRTQALNTLISFYNAAEEKINGAPVADSGQRLSPFELSVLAYFDLDLNHKNQVERLIRFSRLIYNTNRYDLFKVQFSNYVALKNITGFRHGFFSFLGTEEKGFEDSAWISANWAAALANEKAKTVTGPKKGAAAVIETFTKIKMND